MENVKKVVKDLEIKKGSAKSLSLKTISVLKRNGMDKDEATATAKEFTKSVVEKYGKDFTQANVREHFVESFSNGESSGKSKSETKPSGNTKNTSNSKDDFPVLHSRKAKEILAKNHDDLPINEKIRKLLLMTGGKGISKISKLIIGKNGKHLSYQRVKNVKKKMEEFGFRKND